MYIYRIINKINNKTYIGQTVKELRERFSQHCNDSSNCTLLKKAIKKYGKENFEIKLIQEVYEPARLDEFEHYYIRELNTLAPNGYNLTTGGAAPRHSEITKQKMSETRKGKHPHWATEASRSLEARAKRAESHRGKKASEKTIIKMKASANKLCKAIKDQNGKIYRSTGDAAKELNLSRGNICMILSGKRKSTGSFKFEYVN